MSRPSLPKSPSADAPQAVGDSQGKLIVPEHITAYLKRYAASILKELGKGKTKEDKCKILEEVWEKLRTDEKFMPDFVYFRAMFPTLYDAIVGVVPDPEKARIDATLDAQMAELTGNASPPAAPTSAPPAPSAPTPPAAPASAAPQVPPRLQGTSRLCRPQGASPGPRTGIAGLRGQMEGAGPHPSNIHGDGTSSASESTEMTSDASLAPNHIELSNWAEVVGRSVLGCAKGFGKIGPCMIGLLVLLFVTETVSYIFLYGNLGLVTNSIIFACFLAFSFFMTIRKEWQDGKK